MIPNLPKHRFMSVFVINKMVSNVNSLPLVSLAGLWGIILEIVGKAKQMLRFVVKIPG